MSATRHCNTVLHDYWRSSASYRVRIALNLLGIPYERKSVNLVSGEQTSVKHLSLNPSGAVPVLEIDGKVLTQSLAIVEYLAETHPGSTLLPAEASGRARVRALSQAIASDIHPICNLRTVRYLLEVSGGDQAMRLAWMHKFIGEGLAAVEILLQDGDTGLFCHGNCPTMADLCLVPQLYNAARWGADTSAFTKINRIAEECARLNAFQTATPELSIDIPT